jgi:hypothetical protein
LNEGVADQRRLKAWLNKALIQADISHDPKPTRGDLAIGNRTFAFELNTAIKTHASLVLNLLMFCYYGDNKIDRIGPQLSKCENGSSDKYYCENNFIVFAIAI